MITKAQLISAVSAVTQAEGYPQASNGLVQVVVDNFLDAMTDFLKREQSVRLHGFGTFYVHKSRERAGVNPRNPSQKISIPAHAQPKFKAGFSLKSAVRARGA